MPTYQGGIATAGSSVTAGATSKSHATAVAAGTDASVLAGGPTEKTRNGSAGVAAAVGPRGTPAKGYAAGGVPTAGGASVITGQSVKSWPGHPGVGQTFAFGGIEVPVVTDAQYDEAERRAERWPAWSLEVDWTDQDFTGVGSDLTHTVRSVQVERSITGELPDESGVVDGYATGTLTAALGGMRDGADMELAAELSPYRADSPLFGQTLVTPTVRYDLGLLTDAGEKTYRQITGPIRSLRVAEREQSVRLTAVDPSERIRELITLPTYAEFVTHAKRRNWALTINTQWVVDHVLRANNIYTSPPPRPDAIISCTGHGGLASEIGFNGAPISLVGQVPQAGIWTDDQHPYGLLGTPEPRAAGGTVGYQELYGITDGDNPPFRFAAGQGVGFSLLLHVGTWMNMAASTEMRVVQIRPGEISDDNSDNETPRLFLNAFGNGDVYAGLVTESGAIHATPRIPTGPDRWHPVGLHFRYTSNTTLVITVRGGAATRTYTLTVPAVTPARGYRATLQANPQMTRGWSNLQVWVNPAVPSLAEWQAQENHVPEADVGRGVNELLYLPDIAAQDSWEVLKAAVGAEFAVHGFTPDGRYFFRPRTDVRNPTVDVDITVDTNLSEVAYELSSDSVRNVIGYSSTPRYHSGEFQTVVQAQDVLEFVCDPGITKFEMDWPWGAVSRLGGYIRYRFCDSREPLPQPQWSSDVPHGFTYSYGTNWTGEQNPQIVGVCYCQIDKRRIRVTVDNRGTQPVRLATDADVANLAGNPGEPALHVGGWPMISLPDHVETYRNEASIAKYRSPRALSLPSSEWRQTPDVLDPVAQTLLRAMAEPVAVLEDLPVRGNPRVQVGQTARLRFRGEAAQPIIGTITKTNRTLDGNGITDQISVRPLPEQTLAPAGWSFYIDISHHQGNRVDPIDLPRMRALGYAGNVIRIGQGGGEYIDREGKPATHGRIDDAWWPTFRDQSLALWGLGNTAGYWYLGNTETPTEQATRCAAALGTVTTTVRPEPNPRIDRVRTDGPFTLGTEIVLPAGGWIEALRFYRPNTSVGGTMTGRLYRSDGGAVAGTDVTFTLSGTGWQSRALAARVWVPAGTYIVSVLYPGSFPETRGALWPTDRNRGVHGLKARWVGGSTLAFPVNADASAHWWADVQVTTVTSIPVMLDWEDGSGPFQNLLACRDAFRAAGIKTTMAYSNRGYASLNAPAGSSLAGADLTLISSRYWTSTVTDHPRVLWDDMPAGFGYEPFLGVTPRAHQFTDKGLAYPGMVIDVDSFPGTATELADMFHGRRR